MSQSVSDKHNQWSDSGPIISGDLVGCYRSLTDTETTEYRATQLVYSIKFKLSHALCWSFHDCWKCLFYSRNAWTYKFNHAGQCSEDQCSILATTSRAAILFQLHQQLFVLIFLKNECKVYKQSHLAQSFFRIFLKLFVCLLLRPLKASAEY